MPAEILLPTKFGVGHSLQKGLEYIVSHKPQEPNGDRVISVQFNTKWGAQYDFIDDSGRRQRGTTQEGHQMLFRICCPRKTIVIMDQNINNGLEPTAWTWVKDFVETSFPGYYLRHVQGLEVKGEKHKRAAKYNDCTSFAQAFAPVLAAYKMPSAPKAIQPNKPTKRKYADR